MSALIENLPQFVRERGPALVGDSIPPSTLKTRARADLCTKKGHSCKPLQKEFSRGGFNYRQIAREGGAAIYEQSWSGCSEPSVCYEAIRIRRHNGFEIGGKFVAPAEVYPSSTEWGKYGFTFTDKDAAFAKLLEVWG